MERQAEAPPHPPSYSDATKGEVAGEGSNPMPPAYHPPAVQPLYGQPGYVAAPPGQMYPAYQVYPQGYGQYQVQYGCNVQVVQTQPMLTTATVPSTPPPDHMCAAIFVTLCCFWPTGIIAIMKANDSRCAIARGDMYTAHQAATSSKQMVNISIIVGIIGLVIAGIIIGLYVGLFLSHFKDMRYD